MKKNVVGVMLLLVCSFGLFGCPSKRAFTKGSYEDPTVIQMLSDQFSENDLQLIAKKMVTSLGQSPLVMQLETRPFLIVGRIENKTSEHIDMESLANKTRVELIKQGRFSFINKKAREEIAEEYEYQGSGYVKEGEAKGPGGQASADFLMTGRITSIVQEVGRDKVVYYKFTMELTDLASGVIAWTDEKELRKQFKKRAVSW